jgi:hypothetical protein
MYACPSCNNALSDRAIFCGACSKQARCKVCHELLESNARACVICGTLLGEGQPANGHPQENFAGSMNTFFLKETSNTRTVEVSFSDTAIVNLGDVLGYVGSSRIGKRKPTTDQSSSQLLLPGASLDLDNGDVENPSSVINRVAEPSVNLQTTGERERIREVFAQDGERLVLDNLRLKASGQLDAARRLVYLFLYAHELDGHQQVSREAINEVLKDIGLYDPNISNWISTSPDLREADEDGHSMFRLRKTGRDEAKRVLAEVFDDTVKDTWTLTDRSRTRAKTGGEGASIGTTNKTTARKKAVEPDDWAAKWTALELGVDGHSIVEEASSLNKGLFGLWAIRRATQDAIKVVSDTKLVAFLHKAFVVKVARTTLISALESKKAKGKVIRVGGGYEITPTGIKEAESMSGLDKNRSTSVGKGSKK